MAASQAKIIECSTGDFAVQADAVQRDAGRRVPGGQRQGAGVGHAGRGRTHNDDGSVDVLVAVRVKVTNSQAADQEQGYRLRVKMAPGRRHLQDRQAGPGHVVTAVLDSTPDVSTLTDIGGAANALASWPAGPAPSRSTCCRASPWSRHWRCLA